MGYKQLHIEPYKPALDQQLLDLEKKALQGKMLKLEMMRNSFLSRSVVFDDYAAVTGFNDNGDLVAGGIGANVPLGINGEIFDAGFGFDVRVAPEWRNNGAGRQLAEYISAHFFNPNGLKRNFITLKASNIPVIKLSARAVKKISLADFTYLSIPTHIATGLKKQHNGPQQFYVKLMSKNNSVNQHISEFKNGLCVWHTHHLYRLKIRKIHPLIQFGSWLIENTKKIRMPHEGEIVSFACLYNFNKENIHQIDEVLAFLKSKYVTTLVVCCKKNDLIWKALKPFAIYSTPSYILADFPILHDDTVTLDVRCL